MAGFAFVTPFDGRSVEPASFAAPPPRADYHVQIVRSEAVPVKDDPTSGMLVLTLVILDPGPYQGREIPYRLNLFNTKNQTTVEIAYRQLSSLTHVCRVFPLQHSSQLHMIPFIANIGPQTNNPDYPNVFGVKDINGVAPGKAAQGQVVSAQTPAPQALPTQQQAWQPGPPQPAAWTPQGAPPPTQQPQQLWGAPSPQTQPPAAAAWQPGGAPPSNKAPWEK